MQEQISQTGRNYFSGAAHAAWNAQLLPRTAGELFYRYSRLVRWGKTAELGFCQTQRGLRSTELRSSDGEFRGFVADLAQLARRLALAAWSGISRRLLDVTSSAHN
jgi:hypothetical protein